MKSSTSLKGNRAFLRLYAKGRRHGAKTLVLYCRRNGRQENRLGITVSSKLGGAVLRNRVRRRIREIYRLNEDKLRHGYDIVAVARGGIVSAEYADIEADFLRLAEILELIK